MRLTRGCWAVRQAPAAQRPDLADLLEEVVGLGDLEAETGQRLVGGEAGLAAGPHQLDAVGQHQRDLLHRGAARLLDAVAEEVGGVPARHALGAELDQLDRQLEPALRRERGHAGIGRLVVPVHRVAAQVLRAQALALGVGDVLGQRRDHLVIADVDHVHLGQVHAVEQALHVGHRVDRHAALADAPPGRGVVGVEALVGDQVVDQVVEVLAEVADHALGRQQVHALAGVLGQAEADHRLVGPVHELVLGRQVAPREGVLPGGADGREILALEVVGEVGGFQRQARVGLGIARLGRRPVAELVDDAAVVGLPARRHLLRSVEGFFVVHDFSLSCRVVGRAGLRARNQTLVGFSLAGGKFDRQQMVPRPPYAPACALTRPRHPFFDWRAVSGHRW
jgi:hypothetical protein